MLHICANVNYELWRPTRMSEVVPCLTGTTVHSVIISIPYGRNCCLVQWHIYIYLCAYNPEPSLSVYLYIIQLGTRHLCQRTHGKCRKKVGNEMKGLLSKSRSGKYFLLKKFVHTTVFYDCHAMLLYSIKPIRSIPHNAQKSQSCHLI